MLCWVGAVLVAVREVLGPTVASSGAVLGNHSGQQKDGITNKFGGCKSGTQSKASVG